MDASIQGIVIDCADPTALAAFWARILDARWGVPFDGWAVVDTRACLVAFQQVPEPKPGAKNRVHLDLQVADLAVAAQEAVRHGGRVIRRPQYEGDSGFVVLQDPEGNEFCFVTDPSGSFMGLMRSCLTREPGSGLEGTG